MKSYLTSRRGNFLFMKKKIESQGTVSMDRLCFGGRYRNHVSFLCYNGENQSVYWMMEKNMNLLLLIFTFITNWIVSASFWALYFLFTVPFSMKSWQEIMNF